MESIKGKIQTLHAHTTNSDGAMTPEQLLQECYENGIGVVAFTDHDTLPTKEQAARLNKYKNFPTKYIYGIELTSGYPKEIYHLDPKIFHVVGLFVDPLNKDIIDYTREYKTVRAKRIKMRISEFSKLGFEISNEDVFSQVTKDGIPTSLNLILALLAKPSNKKIIEVYFSKIKKMSETNKKAKSIYDEIIADERGDRQKYFAIFLKDGSPFKIKLPERKPPEMESLVSLIRRAGGVATLGHWSFERANLKRELIEKLAREKRVDGVETVYDLFLLENSIWKRKFQLDRSFLRETAKKYGLFTSGGVDAHKKEDIKLFADTKSYSRETVGMAQKIIASTNCDVKNSSLVNDVDY